MAAVHHRGFWKFAVFVMRPLSACRSASWCKISLISDNRLTSNCQNSDFQDGGRRHLEFKNFNFWSRVRNRVQYLMLCTKFHWNRKIFHWDGDITIFSEWYKSKNDTRSSAVAEKPRDASFLSVVSFKFQHTTAQFFITSYCGFRFTTA